jgi:hypothetical protein
MMMLQAAEIAYQKISSSAVFDVGTENNIMGGKGCNILLITACRHSYWDMFVRIYWKLHYIDVMRLALDISC